MKRFRSAYLSYILLATFVPVTDGCRLIRGHTDDGSTIKADGTVVAGGPLHSLFSGYHEASHDYTFHTCMAPASVIDSAGHLKPEFLLPVGMGGAIGKSAAGAQADAAKQASGDGVVVGIRSGDATATIDYISDASTATLTNKISGGVHVNMDLGAGHVDGSVEAALENGATQNSMSYTLIASLKANSFQATVDTGSVHWQLTDFGNQVAFDLSQHVEWSDDQKLQFIAEQCGTAYIDQINFGSTLMLNVKYSSQFSSDLTNLHGQLDVQMATVNGGGSLTIDKNSLSDQMHSEVHLLQIGGQPADSLSAFGKLVPQTGGGTLSVSPCLDIVTCTNLFVSALTYAVNGKPLPLLVDNQGRPTVTKDANGNIISAPTPPTTAQRPSDIFSKGFAQQLSDSSLSGYNVSGYHWVQYSIEDFLNAGMLGADKSKWLTDLTLAKLPPAAPASTPNLPTGPSVATPTSPDAPTTATVPTPAAPPATIRHALPASTVLRIDELLEYYGDYIDLYSYVRDIDALIPDLGSRLGLSINVKIPIMDALASIQKVLEDCRSLDATACQQEVDTAKTTIPKQVPPDQYFNSVALVVADALRHQDFLGYCNLRTTLMIHNPQQTTSQWREMMGQIADTTIRGRTITYGKAPDFKTFDIRTTTLADAGDRKKDPNGNDLGLSYATDENAAITNFCQAISTNLTSVTYLDLSQTGLDLDPEPLTYLTNILELKIDGTKQRQIMNRLSVLPSVNVLTVVNAGFIDKPFAFAAFPSLTNVSFIDASNLAAKGLGYQLMPATNLVQALVNNPNISSISFTSSTGAVSVKNFPFDWLPVTALGNADARSLNKVVVDNGSALPNVGATMFHAETVFGYRTVTSKDAQGRPVNSCQELVSDYSVIEKWLPISGNLDLHKDSALPSSPCCAQAKKRCTDIAGLIGVTNLNLNCDAILCRNGSPATH